MFKKTLCMMLFIISPYSHATALTPMAVPILKSLLEYQEEIYLDCINNISPPKETVTTKELNNCEKILKEIKSIKEKIQ